jgi:hypothetical protein
MIDVKKQSADGRLLQVVGYLNVLPDGRVLAQLSEVSAEVAQRHNTATEARVLEYLDALPLRGVVTLYLRHASDDPHKGYSVTTWKGKVLDALPAVDFEAGKLCFDYGDKTFEAEVDLTEPFMCKAVRAKRVG